MQQHEAPDITTSTKFDVKDIFWSLVADVDIVSTASPLPRPIRRFPCGKNNNK
jgi:hypothetical protein